MRGPGIGMVFQEPMSSLNPVFTIGDQIGETLRAHERLGPAARRARTIGAAGPGGHSLGGPAAGGLPAPDERRAAAAGDDRHRAGLQPAAADRGRADHGAGRHDPGADPGPAAGAAGGARHGRHADHPQHGRGGGDGGPRAGDVFRPHRGTVPGRRAVRPSGAPLHVGAAGLRAVAGDGPAPAASHSLAPCPTRRDGRRDAGSHHAVRCTSRRATRRFRRCGRWGGGHEAACIRAAELAA